MAKLNAQQMIIHAENPRANWEKKCEEVGFSFHSIDGVYLDESRSYEFSSAEIDIIEDVTNELHQLTLAGVEEIIRRDWFARLGCFRKLRTAALSREFNARRTR